MVFSAHWEQVPEQEGQERAPRKVLRLEVHGSSALGSTRAQARNISATGLLLECELELPVGEVIVIDLPQVGSTRAKIVWTSGNLFGCQFHTPLPTGALSAAQLQSEPLEELHVDERPRPPAQESFGLRLQRLRKRRGLTLAQVAASLGVSKPTVWAWENGKARPIETRLVRLAEVLEVPRAELLTGRDPATLDEVLASSRERIAAALGTSAEKVRILLEI